MLINILLLITYYNPHITTSFLTHRPVRLCRIVNATINLQISLKNQINFTQQTNSEKPTVLRLNRDLIEDAVAVEARVIPYLIISFDIIIKRFYHGDNIIIYFFTYYSTV